MKRNLRWLGRGLLGVLALLVIGIAGWVIDANGQIAAREIVTTAGAPGQIITVNGYALHVRVIGDPTTDPTGAPLLLIHAFTPLGGENWFPFAEQLASQRALIIPDMLGYGYSQRVTEPTTDYTHAGQAALIAGLLDALGAGQVDLMGHSYGGAIAAQFTLDYPDRVRRVVLMAAQVYDTGGGFFQQLGTLPLGIGRALTFNFLGGNSFALWGVPESCDAVCAERRQQITLIAGTTDALIAFSNSPRDSRLPGDLAQIAVPTLVIWGDQDEIVPYANGQRLAQELSAELITIPGANHFPPDTDAEAVKNAVLEFAGGA